MTIKAFYVRSSRSNPLADLMIAGWKTIETRTRRTLDALAGTGESVYIIRSGSGRRSMIVGRCYLGSAYWCPAERFHDQDVIAKTRVFQGDPFDVTTGGKWLYDVWMAEPLPVEIPVPDDAVRHGRVWIEAEIPGIERLIPESVW